MAIYAKIENGVIVNTDILDSSDILDPTYTWDDITSVNPRPGVGWTYNGPRDYTQPVISMPSLTPTQIYTNVVLAAMTFGQNIIVQFAVANIMAGITQAGKTQALLAYCANLSMCMNSGSLYSAIDVINSMIADTSDAKANLSPFITNAILTTYKNQIQTYLGIPLT